MIQCNLGNNVNNQTFLLALCLNKAEQTQHCQAQSFHIHMFCVRKWTCYLKWLLACLLTISLLSCGFPLQVRSVFWNSTTGNVSPCLTKWVLYLNAGFPSLVLTQKIVPDTKQLSANLKNMSEVSHLVPYVPSVAFGRTTCWPYLCVSVAYGRLFGGCVITVCVRAPHMCVILCAPPPGVGVTTHVLCIPHSWLW